VGGLTDVVKSPEYSTGVGLVRYACASEAVGVRPAAHHHYHERGVFKRVWSRLAEMF
jgi:cell division ATPase FtsA